MPPSPPSSNDHLHPRSLQQPLIEPSLLEGLTEDQKREALAAAAVARRAEERAEQRALQRAIERKRLERSGSNKGRSSNNEHGKQRGLLAGATAKGNNSNSNSRVKFVSKRQRKEQQTEEKSLKQAKAGNSVSSSSTPAAPKTATIATATATTNSRTAVQSHRSSSTSNNDAVSWTDLDRRAVRNTYLGGSKTVNMTNEEFDEQRKLRKKKNQKKNKSGKKTNFRFEWDDTDDTLRAGDPLYNGPSLGGAAKTRATTSSSSSTNRNHPSRSDHRSHHRDGRRSNHRNSSFRDSNSNATVNSIETKPLETMTVRDWRIFRENHNIVCKGGKAPSPLRNFHDGNILHPSLVKVLYEKMGYRDPTPIQMQAIPIGLQRRDLIGIAETGSGKTAAFGIPLVQYLLQLPFKFTSIERVAEFGPLAMVLAPTRELALQIDGEFQKLLQFSFSSNSYANNHNSSSNRQNNNSQNRNNNGNPIVCCPIVGGQNMTAQAQRLREGVHVVVGTPGRINDCLESAYMVLNQCLYTVLDEGDQMINMGFAPQVESILDHMGGSLKSEDEKEAYRQELADLEQLKNLAAAAANNNNNNTGGSIIAAAAAAFELPKHRVTAMFTATMPAEVEQMAKRYLRHPAVVSIGDRETRNNARIIQKIVFLGNPSQKEQALRRLVLDPRFLREKVIVFVNERKHADGIGRAVERCGRRCVVLHGGKSQDEREHNLGVFRQGGVVLVATDVAGRGLDIPDVAHIINYDLPTRSIESYTHRVGRTGRAGKEGHATSLITDEDEGIMAPLKAYLENTGSEVPSRLARHPAAQSKGSVQQNLIY